MGIPILVLALKDLDEDLIEDAMNYKPMSKKRIFKIVGSVAACLTLVITIGVWYKSCESDVDEGMDGYYVEETTGVGDGKEENGKWLPLFFKYNNARYKYSKSYIEVLPDEVIFVGNVLNMSEKYESYEEYDNLEGSVSGKAYMGTKNDEFMYFIWDEWQGEEEEKSPILIFEKVS